MVFTSVYMKGSNMLCNLCPRACNTERNISPGFCGQSETARISLAAPHYFEEPCISGTGGAGTVFFNGCNLQCVYCQNHELFGINSGKAVTPDELRDIFENLISKGVHNIELVTPTHFQSAIEAALETPLPVPVVWNSGGYDLAGSIRKLCGKIDIYMPDMKYSDPVVAAKYSSAPDYPEVNREAVLEMFRQTGPAVFDGNGLLKRGVLIRHLVLPGYLENTYGVIDWISKTFAPGDIVFSLMSQYTPQPNAPREMARRLKPIEYKMVLRKLNRSGITLGYTQDLDSADDKYRPAFDGRGI